MTGPIVHRYAGFCEEAVYGQDPPPAAAFHLDQISATLDSPADTQLIYPGGLRGDRLHRPGFYSPAGNVVYGTDIRTIGWFLKWLLAGYRWSPGSGGLSTHETWNRGDVLPPSFCTRLGKDNFEHVFSGCVANSLTLEHEGEFIQATLDVATQRDSKGDLIEIDDLHLTDEYPLTFHEIRTTRGDTEISALVKSLNLEVAANADAEAGRGQGSRHPYRIPTFGKQVSGSMNLWFGDTSELERFWGGTDGPAKGGSAEFPLDWALDAGDDGQLDITAPRCIWTGVELQPSGKDEIVQTAAFKLFLADIERPSDSEVVSTELLCSLTNAEPEMVVGSA